MCDIVKCKLVPIFNQKAGTFALQNEIYWSKSKLSPCES